MQVLFQLKKALSRCSLQIFPQRYMKTHIQIEKENGDACAWDASNVTSKE